MAVSDNQQALYLFLCVSIIMSWLLPVQLKKKINKLTEFQNSVPTGVRVTDSNLSYHQ